MRKIFYTFLIAGLFISCTKDPVHKQIHYPQKSSYGSNILFGDTVVSPTGISMAAYLPAGNTLRIKITGEKYYDPETKQESGGIWYMAANPGQIKNWTIDVFNMNQRSQEYWASTTEKDCDLSIQFKEGIYQIEIFENNATTPTRIKDFKVYPYSW